MSWIRVVIFNIFLTLSLLGFLFLLPPVAYQINKILSKAPHSENRQNLHIYDNFSWAEQHFEEFNALETEYFDYITWRRKDFNGDTITIKNGVRQTYVDETQSYPKKEFWFFGGSTTWGSGVDDNNTFPSLFSLETNFKARNFGEAGWVSRQSLNYYLNILNYDRITDPKFPVHIIFYDGVNDISQLCRTQNSVFGTARESQLKSLIDANPSYNRYGLERTFSQILDFLGTIKSLLVRKQSESLSVGYSCSDNEQRAIEVAKNIVSSWKSAAILSESLGIQFTAILQPVTFYGAPEVEYLELNTQHDQALREQFKVVYPLILSYAKNSGFNFLDFTGIYDGCSNCYIDFCHVGPQAHQILVDNLISRVNIIRKETL